MLTSRDFEIIGFVRELKLASTDTIAQSFFPTLNSCRKRLKIIVDHGYLKRSRDIVSAQYVYYTSKPKQFRHSLLVSDFYRELSKIATIRRFKAEPEYDDIRPDAIIGYEINGVKYLALLEVEISNKGLDLYKYNKLYANERYKKFFPVMPMIFVVSELKFLPPTPYKTVLIDTQFKNLPVTLGVTSQSLYYHYG